MTQPITKETVAAASAKIVMTRRRRPSSHLTVSFLSPTSPPAVLPPHISPARQLAATMLMSVHHRACQVAAPASNSFIDYFIQIANFISAGRPPVGPYVAQNHSACGRQ